MIKQLFFSLFLLSAFATFAQDSIDEANIRKLYNRALKEYQGYQWLEELTEIGSRLAGSENLNTAIMRFKAIADSLGFETQLQKVKIPHWERGDICHVEAKVSGNAIPFKACALGGSVATKETGLMAEVVEITDFDAIDSTDLTGKIAFINVAMDPTYINTFFAYSATAKIRFLGAVEASKKGAVGVIIRSLSPTINEYPHTGSMTYIGAETKIPAAAISTKDAEALSSFLKQEKEVKLNFAQNCVWKDSTYSYNLIADVKGSEKPEEIVLVGGHIDSWDLGTGAHDDGAGAMHALEAAHLLKKENLLPKRTLRVVFFLNEEFGLNGAREYAKRTADLNNVIAMESDAGGFVPRGISIVGPPEQVEKIKSFRDLLEPYGLHQFSQTGAGSDISQLDKSKTLLIGLRPDSQRYFEIHHSALDVLDQVNVRELELGSASLASLIYLLDKYDVVIE